MTSNSPSSEGRREDRPPPTDMRDSVPVQREAERLRQEMETFNQRKAHESRWFALRLVMGYSSVILLGVVIAVASYILLNSDSFSGSVVTSAGAALFVDVLGLLVGVYKIVLNPRFMTKLAPITTADPSEPGHSGRDGEDRADEDIAGEHIGSLVSKAGAPDHQVQS